MDPSEEFISVSVQQWDRLNYELRRLQEQNIFLRQRYNRNLSPMISKNRSLDIHNFKGQRQSEEKQQQEVSQKRKFVTRMTEWSKRMNRVKANLHLKQLDIKKKKTSVHQQQHEVTAQQLSLFKLNKVVEHDSEGKKDYMQQEQKLEPYDGMRIIQTICLFGPKEQDLQKQIPNGKVNFNNQLLYSSNIFAIDQYQIYASQFYTDEGVPGRKLKQSQISTFVDQMIFRKNVKGLDCSLMLFRPQEQNQQLNKSNQILDKVNAVKLLSAFYVQFSDYSYIECEQDKQQKNSPNKSMENNAIKQKLHQEYLDRQQGSNRERISKVMKKYVVKSKYCLCIFTYFPFVNLMQQLITSILDEIKIRRVQKYAMQGDKQKVSIKYVAHELNRICLELKNQMESIPTELGAEATLSLGHFKIMFNFFESKLDDLLFGGWIFQILKIFDRDTLYDIFTNIMTEESICFVSQNLKLLTHVLLFFVSVLPKPFSYPHPCICRAFRYQWLQSPFVVTIGLNQSSKWVEQNAMYYQKKIFVDINDNQVKVRGKKKFKSIKSQKLKKVFHNFYKRLEGNSPMPQFFKKRQTVIRPAARQQNELVYAMLKSLQAYYEQQIFAHLPNPQIISFIKQKSPQLNEHSKISGLLKEVQKYIKQSRKQKQKDSFIELLVQQQIFYMYAAKIYQLQ